MGTGPAALPYCHGYEVRDQPLGVLGGTPEAVQHALLVRQWSPDVTLFPHTNALSSEQRERLTARGILIVNGTIARLVVDNDQLQGVELDGGTVVPRTAVFVRPRFVPNADLLTGLGCAVDGHGWVVHDPVGRTSVAGVWVAGNAADPRAQVISAPGEGSAAAIALNADLVDEDLKRALAQAQGAIVRDVPEVLFVCIHNAGRSQMAASLLDHHAKGRVHVRSAGSAPADRINPVVAAAMDEWGMDLSREFPKPLTDEFVKAADVVITMGCGDACPIYPGKRYEDWEFQDPAGQPVEVVRRIRDDIDTRVQQLLTELVPASA
jgi:protein-tyrosine-phosphatase